jgi:hypothetical protein
MPLEISEIGVYFAVGDPSGEVDAQQGPEDGDQDTEPASLSQAQITAIVERCVQAVLQTLRMQEAR